MNINPVFNKRFFYYSFIFSDLDIGVFFKKKKKKYRHLT